MENLELLKELKKRVNLYRVQLSTTPSVSDTRYTASKQALAGVQLIIEDLRQGIEQEGPRCIQIGDSVKLKDSIGVIAGDGEGSLIIETPTGPSPVILVTKIN